jgi:hypothetical protein
MPDLSGLPALDVVVGLAFLYFLLSIVASSVQELIASAVSWRAHNLEDAIRNLLGDPRGGNGTDWARKLYGHWRIQALFKKPYADDPESAPEPPRRKPSYIPSREFALALFDTLAPAAAKRTDAPSEDLIAEAQQRVDDIGNERVKRQLSELLATARRDIDAGRRAAERLYNDTLERASGWYKRKAQYSVWAIGLLVAFGLNVNSFQVGSRLWKDDALRAAVVARAQKAAEAPAAGGQATKDDRGSLEEVARSVDDVQMLELPLGWAKENQPSSALGWIGWFFGCLVTTAAVGLGAPFWFDVLRRVSRLRGAGRAPGPGGDQAAGKPADPDDPSPPPDPDEGAPHPRIERREAD